MMKGLIIAAAIVAASIAQADPGHGHGGGHGPRWHFDQSGWVLLGQRTLDGRGDRDVIAVNPYRGRFDELSIVVEDGELRLEDFTVVFANGERFSPRVKHAFREGQRSRVIDLPGDDRAIARIELMNGRWSGAPVTLSVFGRDRRQPMPAPPPPVQAPPPPVYAPPPPPPAFDARGWTRLGGQALRGGVERELVPVSPYAGRFDQLALVVYDGIVDMRDVTITFGNGQRWSPRIGHQFRDGARARVIDLPGNDRNVVSVELTYAAAVRWGQPARFEIYGRDLGRPAPPPPTPIVWDSRGWSRLASSTVDGWRDRDHLGLRIPGLFNELMLVAAGSPLAVQSLVVVFDNGQRVDLGRRVVLDGGQRAVLVDIPGPLRRVTALDVVYSDLPGGGRAVFEVWGRARGTAVVAPPPARGTVVAPPPPARGTVVQPPPPAR
jgi:hypothetical protein